MQSAASEGDHYFYKFVAMQAAEEDVRVFIDEYFAS